MSSTVALEASPSRERAALAAQLLVLGVQPLVVMISAWCALGTTRAGGGPKRVELTSG